MQPMPTPASYRLWILCGVGFLRAPDARLVASLGLGEEDAGWVPAGRQFNGAFIARVTELLADADTVVFDVPSETSAQLATPAGARSPDPVDVLARNRLVGWREAGFLAHRRLESRLADLDPEAGRGGFDQALLAAARTLVLDPGTHVAILHSSAWIDAQLTASPADCRIHTPGHLAPLVDPVVLASRELRGWRRHNERAQMIRWSMLMMAAWLACILALIVLPVALAWDNWRVPLWALAGTASLVWLCCAAWITHRLRSQPAS